MGASIHTFEQHLSNTEIIMGKGSANERRCYFVTPSFIGWTLTLIFLVEDYSIWTHVQPVAIFSNSTVKSLMAHARVSMLTVWNRMTGTW